MFSIPFKLFRISNFNFYCLNDHDLQNNGDITMGPLKLAAMHGLSASRGSILEDLTTSISPSRAPKDERVTCSCSLFS